MDELFGLIFVAWVVAASWGTVDNLMLQTPDARIIKMCSTKGYLNVGQERITCSVDKKD